MWKKHREDVGMMSCDVCDTFKTDMPSKLKVSDYNVKLRWEQNGVRGFQPGPTLTGLCNKMARSLKFLI